MHNLMGHMHLHSDSKPFKCLYCPSKFTLKGNLTRHMKVKHGVMERGLHSQGMRSPKEPQPARPAGDKGGDLVHRGLPYSYGQNGKVIFKTKPGSRIG